MRQNAPTTEYVISVRLVFLYILTKCEYVVSFVNIATTEQLYH